MKLKIEICMDNDAFTGPAGVELARILRRFADHVDRSYPMLGEEPLMDLNGNTVGKAEVVED